MIKKKSVLNGFYQCSNLALVHTLYRASVAHSFFTFANEFEVLVKGEFWEDEVVLT